MYYYVYLIQAINHLDRVYVGYTKNASERLAVENDNDVCFLEQKSAIKFVKNI